MKGNLTKRIIEFVLLFAIFMYLFSGKVFADTTQIDLNSLENIQTIETNDTTNNVVVNNTTNNVTNNIQTNTTALPATGSNTEIVFVIGVTILAGTAIYIFKKVNSYKDI